jgi:hypothetical protein
MWPPKRYGIATGARPEQRIDNGSSIRSWAYWFWPILDEQREREYCDGVIYATPRYTREEVDAAGLALIESPVWRPDVDHALEVVNNWRASHAFPLNTFQMTLKTYAKAIDIESLCAQRTKRLQSIKIKLERYKDKPPFLTLSTMQDLGGCRAVMTGVGGIHDLVQRYKASRLKHVLESEDDYISKPKKSGYRGIHLIYRYNSDKKATYNGLLIEIQVRSVYMHAWATAVETVDTFTNQRLKTGGGQEQWQRFFALMSTHFASLEGTPLVRQTPSAKAELIEEIRHLAHQLEVVPRLEAFGDAIRARVAPDSPTDAHYFVLELDTSDKYGTEPVVSIYAYPKEELLLAERKEQELASIGMDVVMVSVDSIDALHKAYPNYFLDTKLFLTEVRRAIRIE